MRLVIAGKPLLLHSSAKFRDLDLLVVEAGASPAIYSRESPPASEIALSGGSNLSAKGSLRWAAAPAPSPATTIIPWRKEPGAEDYSVASCWTRLLHHHHLRLTWFLPRTTIKARAGNQNPWLCLRAEEGIGAGHSLARWEFSQPDLQILKTSRTMQHQICLPFLPCSLSEAEKIHAYHMIEIVT